MSGQRRKQAATGTEAVAAVPEAATEAARQEAGEPQCVPLIAAAHLPYPEIVGGASVIKKFSSATDNLR